MRMTATSAMPTPAKSSVALPCGVDEVAQHRAFNKRDADGQRERDSEADHFNRSDEQDVGDVEDEAADRRVEQSAESSA